MHGSCESAIIVHCHESEALGPTWYISIFWRSRVWRHVGGLGTGISTKRQARPMIKPRT